MKLHKQKLGGTGPAPTGRGGLDLQVMIRFVDESLLTFTRTSFLLFGLSWFFRNNAETWNQRDG